MPKELDHALTLRMPQTLHAELAERAAKEERTVAGVLRLAARQYLANAR